MEDYGSETESQAAARISELKRCIQERDRTIIKMMKRPESLTDQEEYEDEVENDVRSLKMAQENVKNLLKELMKDSSLRIDVLERIKEIEEEEDRLKKRLTNLMRKINGEDYEKGGEDYDIEEEEEEEDSVEPIKKGGIAVIRVKIAQLLELVCCCFMAGKSKKQEDCVSVNEQVEAIKKGSIEVGVKISGFFVDVMLMLSGRNVLRKMEFQGFKNSLETDSDDEAPAINKFVAVIGIVEGILRSMKIPELPESSSVPEISDLDGSRITKILDKLRPEILHLNLLMMDSRKSNLTEADVFSMKDDLKECEKNSKIIEEEVKNYWAGYSSLFFEPQELENLKEEMKGKINEIWKGESEKKEQ